MRIVAGCTTMGRLIDAILTLSRTARQPLNKIPVNMERLAWETYGQIKELYPEKEIMFEVGMFPDSQADPILIRQVLDNLIGNAVKYSSKRELPRIELGATQLNGATVYFVSDNGIGFDMQYADRLFAVFQRMHSAKDFAGSGVGLAIAQNIIQRHGGKIWAKSVPDSGATFFFTL
jgi:light-regulated signal transduction histidine kinase (bacteriophytochrome)